MDNLNPQLNPNYEQSHGYPGVYPHQQAVAYSPQQAAAPTQQGGIPPQQGAYPVQQGAYPVQQGAYPVQQGVYPVQQGAVLPQKFANPPTQPMAPGFQPLHDGSHIITSNEGRNSLGAGLVGDDVDVKFFDFNDQTVRRGFIRKVYGILSCQLLVTMAIIAFFIYCHPVKQFVSQNVGALYAAFGLYFAMALVLLCVTEARRKAPLNFILLFVFTGATGYMLGAVGATMDASEVNLLRLFGLYFAMALVLLCVTEARRKAPLNFMLLFVFTGATGYMLGAVGATMDASEVNLLRLFGLYFAMALVLLCVTEARRKAPLNFMLLFVFTGTTGYMLGAVGATMDASEVNLLRLFGLYFAMALVLLCVTEARRKAPLNFMLLFVFTGTTGYMLGAVGSTMDASEVMMAAGVTAVICFSLTLFAFQTKYDFTMCSGFILCAVLSLLFLGILCSFFPSRALEVFYCAIGIVIFSFSLVYHTQLMIGGNHKYSITPEEYVFAALTLYLDVINIFIRILRLMR